MAFIFQENSGPYTINVGVTNTSAKDGVPWAAALTVEINMYGPVQYILDSRTDNYAGGKSMTLSWQFSISMGEVGVGTITVTVRDPSGAVLDSAVKGYTIEEIPIDYGADVVIN